ncbi:MAG: O-antigen ligase family protein [Chloroflexi bacterium]|nr:O-antigen ligase family protein [Chloroflexota bacterium]
MIVDKLPSSVNPVRSPARWIEWLRVLFALLAIGTGLVIALSVGEFGPLILLVIPLLFMLLLALGQPQLGLVGLIIITFTQLSNVGIIYHGLPSMAQPLAALLILLIIVRFALFGERPEGWLRAGPLLLIYALVWFAALLHAGNFQAASAAFIGFVKDALGAVIVIFFIQKPASFKGAVWAVIFAGLLMGAVCVFQTLTGTFANNYFGFGGWQLQNSGAVTNHRLTGPYTNPNAFAQVLVFIVPLTIDRLWHERNLTLRVFAGAAALVSILTVIFTYSRGGLLALVFTIGLLVALRRPNFLFLLLTVFLAIGVIQFLPTTYNSRILTLLQFTDVQGGQLSDKSFRGRTSENTAAWRMFLDNPLLGVGLGNFSVNYQDYSRTIGLDTRRDQRSPASLYMELLSEQGFVGTVIFFWLMAMIFRELNFSWKNFIQSGLTDEGYMILAITAGFAGYLFAGITKNSAYSNVFWVIVGIAMASGQVAHSSRLKAEELSGNQPGYDV